MRAHRFRMMIVAAAAGWLFAGCASLRESVNWEFKAEETQLEPHEQRYEDLRYLAQPK